MNEQNNKHGRREATQRKSGWLQQRREWLESMDRGQKTRYRIFQAVTLVSLLIIAVFLALRGWIRMPNQPSDLGDGVGLPSFEGAEAPGVVSSGRKKGVYTFLLAGRDVASGSTDTMILLTYDTEGKTLHGLNLPRDTMVNVSTRSKRLNAVYSNNKGKDKKTQVEKGMTALKKEVANLTGVTPDYYIMVEWEAVGKLVDALGGVEFEVPFDMNYDDPYQDLHIHQKAGLRKLSGDDAMQVIRHRKNNDGSHSKGDVGRLQIQQDFLKATAKKCLQPATFLKIPSLAEIFMENVKTDLTVGNIIALAQQAMGMDPDTGVSFETAPLAANFRYGGADMVTLDVEQLLQVVNEKMNPYRRDIQRSDLCVLVRNSNGSFGVTHGALADDKMGQKSAGAAKPQPEKPKPQEPQPERPDSSAAGDRSEPQTPDVGIEPPDSSLPPAGGATEPDGGDTGAAEPQQPPAGGDSQPGPEQNGTDGGTNSSIEEPPTPTAAPDGGDTIAFLPPRPQPVEQAA